jgi:hypothetical protein
LNINVPVSRQQFPMGSCTSPEKLISPGTGRLQTAGTIVFTWVVDLGPMIRKVPVPFDIEIKVNLRDKPFSKVNVTSQPATGTGEFWEKTGSAHNKTKTTKRVLFNLI